MVFCVEPCLLTCIPYHFQGKLATPWKFTLELIIIPLLLVLKISLFLVRATRPHRKRPFSPLFVTLGTFASSIHFPYTFHTVSTHYLLLLLLFIRAQPEKLRLSFKIIGRRPNPLSCSIRGSQAPRFRSAATRSWQAGFAQQKCLKKAKKVLFFATFFWTSQMRSIHELL